MGCRRGGNAKVIDVLLEHGVEVDMNEKDNGGRTPLSWNAASEQYHGGPEK